MTIFNKMIQTSNISKITYLITSFITFDIFPNFFNILVNLSINLHV